MTGSPSGRRGYALVLVLIFVVLFGVMLGVAWRRVASALRIEYLCEVRKQCDAGSIQVLAQAMQVLETRLRQTSQGAELDGSDAATLTYKKQLADGGPWYTVTFSRDSSDGTQWSVSVAVTQPNQDLSGLPALPGNPP